MRIRELVAAVTALLTVFLLGGCGGDTRREVDESRGQVERTSTIDALDLVLVTNGKGVARLIGTLVNQADRPDRLVGLDVDVEPSPRSVILADGPFVLRQNEPFELYREANVTVVSTDFEPGLRADVTLLFANSERLVTTVPVERNVGIYSDVEVTRPPDGDIRPEG